MSPIEKLKQMPFEAYLVGGCVRDMVLKREPKDFDYVVVGESPESMAAFGARSVGQSFPVFLMENDDAEYALARFEKSTGPGYNDFEFVWDGVSLHDDLYRRDTTMNAMALDRDGKLYDPYGGQKDIENRTIRHVSPHFVEDPLRIFRVARFAAQLGFDVAPELMVLMTHMVEQGMVKAMTKERMTAELIKALVAPYPRRFFEVLDEVGALKEWLPMLSDMHGVPQVFKYHAEGDVWTHNLMVLDEATAATVGRDYDSKLRVRAAALLHDVGKTRTPHRLLWNEDGTPLGKHHYHDQPELMETMFDELRKVLKGMDSSVLWFAKQVAINHQALHRIFERSNGKLIKLYDLCGGRRAFDLPWFADDMVAACTADHFGRLRADDDGVVAKPGPYPEADYFKDVMRVVHDVPEGKIIGPLIKAGKSVEEAKKVLHRERLRALAIYRDPTSASPEEPEVDQSPSP